MNYLDAYERANRRCIELLAEKTAYLSIIKHEQKRREELSEENAKLRGQIAEIEAKLAAAEKMREALKFYASPDGYADNDALACSGIDEDGGIIARTALKAYEEAGR